MLFVDNTNSKFDRKRIRLTWALWFWANNGSLRREATTSPLSRVLSITVITESQIEATISAVRSSLSCFVGFKYKISLQHVINRAWQYSSTSVLFTKSNAIRSLKEKQSRWRTWGLRLEGQYKFQHVKT